MDRHDPRGGVDLPGEVGGLVALDELVIHGWDIAQTLGRPYNCDQVSLEAVLAFVQQFGDDDRGDGGLFGPPSRSARTRR